MQRNVKVLILLENRLSFLLSSKLIFHITHIDNLTDILQFNAILCKNMVLQNGLNPISIAYEGIQDRRHTFNVPIIPGGVLHDYVPFSFAPRSPMLYTIKLGNVLNYNQGQEKLIYLVSDTKSIIDAGLQFVFTNGHPIVILSNFFNNINLLDTEIDWKIMKEKYWRDTPLDPDRKRRRQAEFLVFNSLPFNLILGIGVYDNTILQRIEQILKRFNSQTSCKIKSTWYY